MTAERQTSDARRALRLAIACALGTFAGTRLSGGRGLRFAAFRLRLHRLGTAAAASAVSRFRWLFGGVGDLLEGASPPDRMAVRSMACGCEKENVTGPLLPLCYPIGRANDALMAAAALLSSFRNRCA
jgi:hypothetical protein